MNFDIPVSYKGQQLLFPSELIKQGYIHTIEVNIFGTKVMYEADEEGCFRALIDPELAESNKIVIDLLKAIAASIEQILK